MALAPSAEFDNAVAGEVGERDELRLAGEDGIVDAAAATLDQSARLAVRGGKSGAGEGLEGRQAFLQHLPLQLDDGQLAADAALLEDAARGRGGGLRRRPAMAERRRLGRQDLLGLVELAAGKGLEPGEIARLRLRRPP